MDLLSSLLGGLGSLSVGVISFLGYPGVVILMALESMVFPLPSEVVMPFAGFLSVQGDMNIWLVILSSALGSLIGSFISYYIGKYGGNAFLIRYGKYFLIDTNDLEKTKQWFAKKGEKTVFISRFIPVVRHFISIPAGMGNMNVKKFCLYTVVGATIWNSFLAYLGFSLGKKWEEVEKYMHYISLPVAVLLVLAVCFVFYRHIKHKKGKSKSI